MAGAPGLAAGDPERHRGLEQYLNEEVFGIPHRADTVVERPAPLAPARLLEVEGARHHLDLAEAGELFHGALSHSVYFHQKEADTVSVIKDIATYCNNIILTA